MPTIGVDLATIEVWAPSQRAPRPGMKFLRAGWIEPSDGRSIDGLEVARRAVCIASIAAAVEAVDLVKLIREACFWEATVFDQLIALVGAHRRLAGRSNLVTAMRWYADGHCGLDSASEKFVRHERRRRGVPAPMLNAELELRDGSLRPDFYWPRQHLLLENNPVGHKRPWVKQSDLGRRARAERDGLDVIWLDRTRPFVEQGRVLDVVARRVLDVRGEPIVPHVIRTYDFV